MWARLRGRRFDGYKFRRQMPIEGYITDFACVEAKLIIELDGGQHAIAEDQDRRRTEAIETAVFRPRVLHDRYRWRAYMPQFPNRLFESKLT